MTASVGFSIVGSGRSSTRTSPGACSTAPRMVVPSGCVGDRVAVQVAVPTTSRQRLLPGGWEEPSTRVPAGGCCRHPLQRHPAHSASRTSRGAMSGADNRLELGEFLASRRARITPDQVGLPVYDAGKRRVPGLRRQEVATLAGLSIDYYTQLERGKAGGVSEAVLDAIARALQLDEAERAHLADLHRSI